MKQLQALSIYTFLTILFLLSGCVNNNKKEEALKREQESMMGPEGLNDQNEPAVDETFFHHEENPNDTSNMEMNSSIENTFRVGGTGGFGSDRPL